jgi:hypothetical protein
VSSSTLITLDPRNQSLAQISRSTIVGVSELLKSSSVLPLALKADSDATVEIGTTKRSRAMRANIGNLVALSFQYLRISNPFLSSSLSCDKYLSSSDLEVGNREWVSVSGFSFLGLVGSGDCGIIRADLVTRDPGRIGGDCGGKLVYFPVNPLQSSRDPLVTKSTLNGIVGVRDYGVWTRAGRSLFGMWNGFRFGYSIKLNPQPSTEFHKNANQNRKPKNCNFSLVRCTVRFSVLTCPVLPGIRDI